MATWPGRWCLPASGMEALEVTNWRELVVADQPAEFMDAVLKLLRDAAMRARIGAAGRELVLRRYTWDACAASYDAIYTRWRPDVHGAIAGVCARATRRPGGVAIGERALPIARFINSQVH
ncbi:MAG: glycosyltransferase [Kouleothrix sp.]